MDTNNNTLLNEKNKVLSERAYLLERIRNNVKLVNEERYIISMSDEEIKNKKFKHIKSYERTLIEKLFKSNFTKLEISIVIGRSKRTTEREFKLGKTVNKDSNLRTKYIYSAKVAQDKYNFNRRKTGKKLLVMSYLQNIFVY